MSKRTRPWAETKRRRRRARDMKTMVAWLTRYIQRRVFETLMHAPVIPAVVVASYEAARAAGLVQDIRDTNVTITFVR